MLSSSINVIEAGQLACHNPRKDVFIPIVNIGEPEVHYAKSYAVIVQKRPGSRA